MKINGKKTEVKDVPVTIELGPDIHAG